MSEVSVINFSVVDSIEKLKESEKKLSNESVIACDLESSGLDIRASKIEGIGYGTNKQQFFIPYPNTFSLEEINDFLTRLFKKIVIFHNAKYDLELLLQNKLVIPEIIEDTLIMSWLIDENVQHGLKELAKTLLGRSPKNWKDLNRELDLFTNSEDIMLELAEYCCADVRNTFDLFQYFNPLLVKEKVDVAYNRVEIKFISVLVAMEMRGVKVDVNWLLQKKDEATKELWKLEKKIVEKIKENFDITGVNIRSSKQLQEIIYEQFKYKVTKETKAGKRSTDEEALQQIIKDNELKEDDVIPLLLKFRELDKLNSTYFTALAEQAGMENVIHTNFKQHGSRTGRISSNAPNLQNIPSRQDKWDVRHAFIPREGYCFIQADYSQIELRMLAHFSQDEVMMKVFKEGGDIHAETMKATGTNRHVAKGIGFGLIYGMGPRTLAQTLNIKEEDAKKYIGRFFNRYRGAKIFIERVQQRTLQYGYVSMITGRKRRFQEYKDNRWFNSIARQAVNTLMQGSAGDLIKIAMINLKPILDKLNSHMLIQIHDELIIETPLDKVEEVKKVIKEEMENSIKLKIPIAANIIESERWKK